MEYKWRITINKAKGVFLTYHEENVSLYSIDVYGAEAVQLSMATPEILKLGETVYDVVEVLREFLAIHEARGLVELLNEHRVTFEISTDEVVENGDNLLRPTEEYLDPKKLH
jgi:hypothetical protein